VLKKIRKIPMGAAIVIMVVCVAAGVALGNKNALDRAIADTAADLHEALDLASDRVDMAEHRLLMLCKRIIPDHEATKALERAVEVCRRAKTPGEIAQADKALDSAAQGVLEPLREAAKESDRKLATGAMDDIISVGKRMKRSADAYNNGLAYVRKVYNALPMRALLRGLPEAFR